MPHDLPVINLHTAKFECTFGRGCDGVCCREGRPPVYADEIARIAENLPKFLPLMRPEASRVAARRGFVSGRKRFGEEQMRVAGGWCIFFNQGCVLHQVGAAEGDKFRYKPAVCALFPIQQDDHDRWYVRQKGFKRERWDLFCLDPSNSTKPAAESLQEELALAQRFDMEASAEAVPEVGLEPTRP
jgi:hypothetical protein